MSKFWSKGHKVTEGNKIPRVTEGNKIPYL